MPVLLASMLAVCLLSFLLSLISRLALSVKVGELPNSVFRKDEVVLTVHLKNRFILPLTPVRVYVKVCAENKYTPENRMIVISVPPMKGVTLRISNIMSYRGEYSIGLEKIEIFDIFKLYSFKKNFKDGWNPISSPREFSLTRIRDDNEDENENARPKLLGFNKNTFSHLREYHEGDTLRHIHWKLSARLDELIVKQMEQNHNNSALVFCDYAGIYPTIEAALSATDPTIEAAMAIVRRILLSGNTAQVIWQDIRIGKSETREVEDSYTYAQLTRCLTLLPPEPFNGEFTQLLSEYENEINLERALYFITPNLNEALVEKLRLLGLTLRRNVVLAAISPTNEELIRYIETQTKINFCRIDNDDVASIGERI